MPTETCAAPCLEYGRQPATWPIVFAQGDEFPMQFRVNRNLAAYTLSAAVINATTGATACTFAVSQTQVTVGGQTHTRVNLTLTEQQTALLVPPATYRWFFRWVTPGGDTLTILTGRVRAFKR